MSMNKVLEQGRIPFDMELKNADDDKKAFMGFSISVQRNYKPEGEQYYPEDLLFCKAFGAKAKFIHKNFGKGSNIIIEGELRRDDDYEKDGQTIKGQMYIHVTDAHFAGGPKKESDGEDRPAKAADKKPAGKTPGAGNPLAKKKSPF